MSGSGSEQVKRKTARYSLRESRQVSGAGHHQTYMRKDQAFDPPVSGTGHRNVKKKRTWKGINAKRLTSVNGRRMGCNRYSTDQALRLERFAGNEFDERIKSGELTIAQALKIIRERAMSALDDDVRQLVKLDIVEGKIRKYWTCMLAAARQTELPAASMSEDASGNSPAEPVKRGGWWRDLE